MSVDLMSVKANQMDKKLQAVLSEFKGREDELIPILQKVQAVFGYLAEEIMLEIAEFVGISESRVFAVASFYAQFRFTPIGRNHIMVCRGTACYVRGGPRILGAIEKHLGIKDGETSSDMEYSLETVACLGCCGLSPCVMINKKVHGKMTPRKVAEIFPKAAKHD